MTDDELRERVWDELADSGVSRFPFPPHDRIPNFEGAGAAADRLADQPEWRAATVIKANPDAPQLPVRRAALRDGKTVYVAVPRLRERRCFVRLDSEELEDVAAATTVSGIGEHGTAVDPSDVERVDLVVAGSVAVTLDGARLGKGEGYSDLEWALLAEAGRVDDETTVATTVHERQVREEVIEPDSHDLPLDLIVTPERVMRPDRGPRPTGINWSLIDEGRRAAIPVLVDYRDGMDGP